MSPHNPFPLADGNDHMCEKFLLLFLSNRGLWVSLVDEDDLGWPREAGRFRMLRSLWLLASH